MMEVELEDRVVVGEARKAWQIPRSFSNFLIG